MRPDRYRRVLGTKFTLSADPDDPNAGGSHRKSLRRASDAGLERLGTDRERPADNRVGTAWASLAAARSPAFVRLAIGVGPSPKR